MEAFKEINPFDNRNPENEEKQFIENPVGSNYLKIEFEGLPELNAINVNRTLKFTEKR